jgi:hypothetical protein
MFLLLILIMKSFFFIKASFIEGIYILRTSKYIMRDILNAVHS